MLAQREIVFFSTLSLGTMNDDTIAVNELRGPVNERLPLEHFLVDGAYETLPRCRKPHRRQKQLECPQRHQRKDKLQDDAREQAGVSKDERQ